MCWKHEETAADLFIQCLVAFELWGEFLRRFNFTWVFLESIPKLLDQWFNGQQRCLSPKGVLLRKKCASCGFLGHMGKVKCLRV